MCPEITTSFSRYKLPFIIVVGVIDQSVSYYVNIDNARNTYSEVTALLNR